MSPFVQLACELESPRGLSFIAAAAHRSQPLRPLSTHPGGSVFVQDAKKAVGGHVLAHLVDTRVSIRKGKGEQRVAKVLQHAFKGEAEATLQITPGGIDDAKD